MKKKINILFVILRLFLGGMMIYGGVQKFEKPIPSPAEVVQKAQRLHSLDKIVTLQKVLYINGVKQTGYFWEVLGICELLFGFLLIIQGTGFVGALFLLPITLHIFLFHLFLEPEELGELIQTGLLFVVNIILVLKEKEQWKHLLWIRSM